MDSIWTTIQQSLTLTFFKTFLGALIMKLTTSKCLQKIYNRLIFDGMTDVQRTKIRLIEPKENKAH